jgi:dTDP-glucose 4,6-dehydratase
MRVEPPLPAFDLQFVHREAAGLWAELKGTRMLITGATGFFGRWLLESLLFADEQQGLGIHVAALSRDPDAFLLRAPHLAVPCLCWIKGSVTTLSADDFKGKHFDAVIHLATEANMQSSRDDPNASVRTITDGTRRTLDVAARTGAKRFLFTSSGAIYGPQPADMEHLSEDYPGRANPADGVSPYALPGDAKREAEVLCSEQAHREGLGAVIARCFSFAGPALPLDSKFAFGNFVGDALKGGPIVIKGDGTAIRSYLYAADLAVWLWTLLLRGVPGRAYNVGSEHPVTILDLAKMISRELGFPRVEVLQERRSGASADCYIPSTQRARMELRLAENFGLPESIRRTAAWNRAEVKY